jgi:hypothetical protein
MVAARDFNSASILGRAAASSIGAKGPATDLKNEWSWSRDDEVSSPWRLVLIISWVMVVVFLFGFGLFVARQAVVALMMPLPAPTNFVFMFTRTRMPPVSLGAW